MIQTVQNTLLDIRSTVLIQNSLIKIVPQNMRSKTKIANNSLLKEYNDGGEHKKVTVKVIQLRLIRDICRKKSKQIYT